MRTKARLHQYHGWADGTVKFRVEAMYGRSYAAMAEVSWGNSAIKKRVDQLVVGTPLATYDLRRDPDERAYVIAESAYRADLELIGQRLLAHMERTGDPERSGVRAAIARGKK